MCIFLSMQLPHSSQSMYHQLLFALFLPLVLQLKEIIRAIHMKSVHVLRLCREKIAQVSYQCTLPSID